MRAADALPCNLGESCVLGPVAPVILRLISFAFVVGRGNGFVCASAAVARNLYIYIAARFWRTSSIRATCAPLSTLGLLTLFCVSSGRTLSTLGLGNLIGCCNTRALFIYYMVRSKSYFHNILYELTSYDS